MSDRSWSLSSLPFSGHRGSSWGSRDWDVKVTTYLHLGSKLRSAAIPLLPQYAFRMWIGKTVPCFIEQNYGVPHTHFSVHRYFLKVALKSSISSTTAIVKRFDVTNQWCVYSETCGEKFLKLWRNVLFPFNPNGARMTAVDCTCVQWCSSLWAYSFQTIRLRLNHENLICW